MSLSKQLLLLISLLFLLIMAVNFAASANNIRSYLEVEAQIHAQDTATSLGLSLSPYIGDRQNAMLESMVTAIYDRGYYQSIHLEDMDGKEIISRKQPESYSGVPDWFVRLLPMATARAETEISSGWVIAGRLQVTVSPGIAYLKLWDQTKEALVFSGVVFLFAVLILLALLRFLLKPLGKIERLALDISDGHFTSISPLPWTAEIRTVAQSMNMMSRKTGTLIENLNTRLEATVKRLKLDELTGLETQSGFELEMKRVFMDREEAHLVLCRIENLGVFSMDNGHTQTDKLVRAFARVLVQVADNPISVNVRPYRLVGAKFVVLLRGNRSQAEAYCHEFIEASKALLQQFGLEDLTHFGIVPVDPFGTTQESLGLAGEAYEKARIVGPNAYVYQTSDQGNRDLNAWRQLLAEVIEKVRFDIARTLSAEGLSGEYRDQLVLEEATSQAYDAEGAPIPIGTFISLAESFGLAQAFDKAVVSKVLSLIQQENIIHDIVINLSPDSAKAPEFLDWLRIILDQHADLKSRLVFAMSAYSVTKHAAAFRFFVDFLHGIGVKVLLKRYDPDLIPLRELKAYKLDYIRLAKGFTQGVSTDEQKRRLVESMAELGQLIDIKVVAEGVDDQADTDCIAQCGLYAASH